MNETKPKKRIVGWTQYIGHGVTKSAAYSVAVVCGFGGLLILAVALVLAVAAFAETKLEPGVLWLAISGFLAVIGISTLVFSNILFEKAKQAAPVTLLTKSSAKHLPEVETLVRCSDRPATAEKNELLRALRDSPETPPEQLLRAAQEPTQDV